MKLEIESKILVGAESKAWLADVQGVLERMEKVARILRSPEENDAASDDAPEADEDGVENDAGFEEAPKAAKGKGAAKKQAASFDDADEEEQEEEAEEEAEEQEDEPKAAKGKAATKLTVDDLNDAAMQCAQRTNRANVLALMKKNFKVKSVTEIEPKDFARFIKVMKS